MAPNAPLPYSTPGGPGTKLHSSDMECISGHSYPRCLPPTVISYGPFFPQSPTNPDVVEKSVEYCMEVAQKMDQEFTINTCDQAIYEVVLGLQKKNLQKYDKLVLRMGGFHIA